MGDTFNDARFAHVEKDPRFVLPRKRDRNVKIDKRFRGMFKGSKFNFDSKVDKTGRPLKLGTSRENLKKFYHVNSSESESSDDDEAEAGDIDVHKPNKEKNKTKESSKESDLPSSDEAESSEADIDKITDVKKVKATKQKKKVAKETIKQVNKTSDEDDSVEDNVSEDDSESDEEESDSGLDIDYSRGMHMMESSSSSDDDDEVDNNEKSKDANELFDHKWGEIDNEAKVTEEITPCLALCNMHWDRIKAHDIMAVLNSFKPTEGNIKSVHIYPSDFGKERMKAEELKGPAELVDEDHKRSEIHMDDSTYHQEKLRQYELNRLKYYYAVIECDSAKTANSIYEECDGVEYESTGNRFDLRFIPNGMTFDQEPSSVAFDLPDTATYKPSTYITTALQQSKVDCTWDATDSDRLAVTMRTFNKDEIEDMDLKDYLASDSDVEGTNPYGDMIQNSDFNSESEDEETQILKYKNLVKSLGEQKGKAEDNRMDMEITWEPGLKETTEELVKKKKLQNSTPWEQYLEKRRERRRQKRHKDDKKQGQGNGEDGWVADSDDDFPSDVDLNDPYFKDELEKMGKKTGTGVKDKEKKDKKATKKGKGKRQKLTAEEIKEKEEQEAELKLLLMEEDDNKQHFNLKQLVEPESKTQKRKKAKRAKKRELEDERVVEDNFKLDMVDPRFNVLFENPHYNIDPSAPEFKKTKAMDSLVNEKVKRSKQKKSKKNQKVNEQMDNSGEKHANNSVKKVEGSTSQSGTVHEKKAKTNDCKTDKVVTSARDIELASLIKSVKTKTERAKSKKRKH